MDSTNPAANLSSLISCPSVTPKEEGVLTVLSSMIEPLGFKVERSVFSAQYTADVENLYASLSHGIGQSLMFAGHVDVVPPGNEGEWTYPPFSGVINNGILYGRGAVDMKGAIACFVAALARYIKKGREIKGSVSLLITGDEEGSAINGTKKLLKWARDKGYTWDACIVGEPSNVDRVGDVIKIGRRGSLSGNVLVRGVQCHVASSQAKENNPIRGLLILMNILMRDRFDEGAENFPATNLEVTSVDTGNTTVNIIPDHTSASFNIRFNTLWAGHRIKEEVQCRLDKAMKEEIQQGNIGKGISFELNWKEPGSEPFLTENKNLLKKMKTVIQAVTGIRPDCSTSGGTSDARFIKDYCPVLEFGLVGTMAHRVDEHVSLDDLDTLTNIYENFLINWFS